MFAGFEERMKSSKPRAERIIEEVRDDIDLVEKKTSRVLQAEIKMLVFLLVR